jgi:hypothetical protein
MKAKEGTATINLRRVTIHDNILDNMNVPPFKSYRGDGRLFVALGGIEDLTIEHNTMVTTAHFNALMALEGAPAILRASITHNIFSSGEYGIKASGFGGGDASLRGAVRDHEFTNNVIVGAASGYAPTTRYARDLSSIGFASLPQKDYRLASRTYRGTAPRGRDPGADAAKVDSLARQARGAGDRE